MALANHPGTNNQCGLNQSFVSLPAFKATTSIIQQWHLRLYCSKLTKSNPTSNRGWRCSAKAKGLMPIRQKAGLVKSGLLPKVVKGSIDSLERDARLQGPEPQASARGRLLTCAAWPGFRLSLLMVGFSDGGERSLWAPAPLAGEIISNNFRM